MGIQNKCSAIGTWTLLRLVVLPFLLADLKRQAMRFTLCIASRSMKAFLIEKFVNTVAECFCTHTDRKCAASNRSRQTAEPNTTLRMTGIDLKDSTNARFSF
uniref:Uncharacterized protein n=1 Tax=Rhipicephalus microplus TaxID=6941 RepID=A0A6G5A1Z4_RHIMP